MRIGDLVLPTFESFSVRLFPESPRNFPKSKLKVDDFGYVIRGTSAVCIWRKDQTAAVIDVDLEWLRILVQDGTSGWVGQWYVKLEQSHIRGC